VNLSDVSKAARLVQHGLDPKQRPTGDSEYRLLFDRYRTDVEFAELVKRVAEGLGLYLRSPTRLGLVLAGDIDGPFAVTLDNCGLPLRQGASRLQDRRCFGLVLTAIAAFAYPNGEALAETDNRPVRAFEIERFVSRHAEEIAAAVDAACNAADAGGRPDELDVQLGEAARSWLDLPEVLPAERGGYRRDCRRSYSTSALVFLVATGRAHREPALDDERGEAFTLNDRFRIGISEITETLVFSILAGGPPGPGGQAG